MRLHRILGFSYGYYRVFNSIKFNLKHQIGDKNYSALNRMFQIRHIWIHNFGEADQDFIRKTGAPKTAQGKKIVPIRSEVEHLFDIVEQIGIDVRKKLGDSA